MSSSVADPSVTACHLREHSPDLLQAFDALEERRHRSESRFLRRNGELLGLELTGGVRRQPGNMMTDGTLLCPGKATAMIDWLPLV